LRDLAREAAQSLESERVNADELHTTYEVEVRYRGQGLRLSVNIELSELESSGLGALSARFDAEHKRLFTFALPHEHELVTLRATVQGAGIVLKRPTLAKGGVSPHIAAVGRQPVYMDGKSLTADVYDRSKLAAGNRIAGPAIVVEMDSTTVILPAHQGVVDAFGNILIYPDAHEALRR
jgi:N-methylhydantoinase A